MPYITAKEKARLYTVGEPGPLTAGELNYVFTTLADTYWLEHGRNYQAFNDIIGALENCKLEYYRRKIGPYEDEKIRINGDVQYNVEGNEPLPGEAKAGNPAKKPHGEGLDGAKIPAKGGPEQAFENEGGRPGREL